MANKATWTMFKSRNVIPWNFGWKKHEERTGFQVKLDDHPFHWRLWPPNQSSTNSSVLQPILTWSATRSTLPKATYSRAATAHDSFKSFKLCKLGILHKTWVTILGIVGIVSLAFLTQVIGACGWHLLDASPTLVNQWNRLHPTYTIIFVYV